MTASATDQLCCVPTEYIVPTVVCELLQSSTVYVPLIRVLLIDAVAKFFKITDGLILILADVRISRIYADNRNFRWMMA